MSAERDKGVAAFPPMTELAQFHQVVADISDCIGDDHDAVPVAMFCVVLRPGNIDQFVLASPDESLALLGAIDVCKLGIIDGILEGED